MIEVRFKCMQMGTRCTLKEDEKVNILHFEVSVVILPCVEDVKLFSVHLFDHNFKQDEY